MKKNITGIGAIITSLLATSCCLGPALFVVFGTSVGFLGKFAVLAPLRPYFLGAAALMLAFSFWKLYLAKPDCDCVEDEKVRRAARLIFWAGTGMFVFALSFQYILVWFYA